MSAIFAPKIQAKKPHPTQLETAFYNVKRGGNFMKPYRKYGYWYVPGCNIQFPTESEAWEYISENM